VQALRPQRCADRRGARRQGNTGVWASTVTDPTEPAEPPQRFDLRLDHVRFRYAPDAPFVLDDLSLNIPAERRVAIVGASGSGKSALVALLARFWGAESGRIQIDGRDLRAYRQVDIRQSIGKMEQRTHLFNTTIRENIWIWRPTPAKIM
jgi:ABC-type bacteriocin/lantibiotic exporter with double-glycine peptidase domain